MKRALKRLIRTLLSFQFPGTTMLDLLYIGNSYPRNFADTFKEVTISRKSVCYTMVFIISSAFVILVV